MLPAWIIEDILRQEREHAQQEEEVLVDRPELEKTRCPEVEIIEDEEESPVERGIAIIDFTI